MNPFTLLKEDHKKVKALFRKYEKAGDRAYKTKAQLAKQVFEELDVHAAVEEEIFYPEVKSNSNDEGRKLVAEGFEEHHVVKVLIAELKKLDAKDERFDAKFKVLMENVKHHIEEEENELFPEARGNLNGKGPEIAQRMDEKKQKLAKTH